MNLEQLKTETDINYLRQVASTLCQSNLILQEEIKKLKYGQVDHEQMRLSLENKLSILKKRMFGKSSEKSKRDRGVDHKQEELLHNQPIVPEPSFKEDTEIPEEEEVHEIKDSAQLKCRSCESNNLREMKGQYEESYETDVIERVIKKIKHKRKKYACHDCENITTAPGPVKLQPGSSYSINFATSVATDKFLYHIPLERQRRQLESAGLNIDVKTLYGLTAMLAYKLAPITNQIREEILSQALVHIDESPIRILRTDTNGYIWNIANQYGSYYHFDFSRAGKVAAELLSNFEGTIMSDGFSGYKKLKNIKKQQKKIKINLTNCWAHARRKFIDARADFPVVEEMIDLIKELYQIDRKAKDLEDLQKLRESESKEVINKIKKWLNTKQNEYLPQLSIAKAIAYTFKLWDGLTYFLQDARVPLDNNAVERALRSPVMGRKNYHGFRTVDGADVGMIYFTLIETCKLMRLNPKNYLNEMAYRAAREEELITPYQYALEIRKS